MTRRPTLRRRIFTSHLALVTIVVVVVALVGWALTPSLFAGRLQLRAGAQGSMGRVGPGAGSIQVPSEVTASYNQALLIALGIATVVGLLLAVLLAVWITRRALGSVGAVQVGAARLAAGDYDHPVGVPSEQELAELARSINTLGSSLAETERARAQLVSDLAHELRNPLATIEGYMEGLTDGVLSATPETYETVAAEAHRLQRLTEDLSLLSRAQEGRLSLNMESVDLAQLAASVIDKLESQFSAKGVSLQRRLPDALPVRGDPDRLVQVLANLIGNALIHTPQGGQVLVTGRRDGSTTCLIEVTDTEEGIPTDQLDLIFERFTRLSSDGSGTGIGLNIARTIAHLHDGTIHASSEGVGKGSTFTLTVPLMQGGQGLES
jgi:signal transduction histidine kinase